MATHHPIRKTVVPEPPVIPDRLYFRIGDVAKLLDVAPYVLRFWETEFKQLKPNKGGTGQRLYRRKDVEMALRVKSLLYDQGYTIPGARAVLQADAKPKESTEAVTAPEAVMPVPVPMAVREVAPAAAPSAPALLALREDVLQLLADLSVPMTAGHAAARSAEPAAPTPVAAKVKPMRPRLVLEKTATTETPHAKPRALKLETPKPSTQGDLFSFDAPPDNDPIAS